MERISTVSQINQYIKNMFASEYALQNLSVKGEVSNCKYHGSGHIYFTLKDRTSQISCVMFSGQRRGLTFRLENGQSVVIFGNIRVFERDGKYQLYASRITKDGIGRIYEELEILKKKLLEEGLFDEKHKKGIPPYVAKVGIVTADTGAAIRDICSIAARRNPYVQLLLYSARVQGGNAKEELIKGLAYFEQSDVDVVIIGRGGGSIEDLWIFNDEELARAVYAAKKPVISAVGHETDTTICDLAADLRAPTPSAAAELAIYPVQAVLAALEEYQMDLDKAMERKIEGLRSVLERYYLLIEGLSPQGRLENHKQRLARGKQQLDFLMKKRLDEKKQKFLLLVKQLEALSPLAKLSSGYAYVTDEEGNNIKSVAQVDVGQELRISLSDGTLEAKVLSR